MSRLAPAEPRGLDPIRRLSFRTAKRMYGRELEPTTVIAPHRPLLAGLGALSLADERFSHAGDDHLKHRARLRAAQVIGCEWCLDFGSYLAQKAGGSEAKLRELSTWRESDQFDPLERLVIEYAEAMTNTPPTVSDELSARLLDRLGPAAMVELTVFIAFSNFATRSNTALGIESQGFSAACEIPPTALAS